jgi:hypothetical protein
MIFIEKDCHSLAKHGVRYAIVGGCAVALNSIRRFDRIATAICDVRDANDRPWPNAAQPSQT